MNYDYLKLATGPQILIQARNLIGTKEIVGKVHSKTILGWAKTLDIEKTYTNDEIAWCGLFMAYVCHKAELTLPFTATEALWAKNWLKFGTKQKVAMIGDVLVFNRKGGGGHVGEYVGEDDLCYHVIGGNQKNMVGIDRIEKTRCIGIRRTPWQIKQPKDVRVVKVNSNGFISQNEA
jgi:uncharacterized protein (TIGR02594 family)